MKTGVCLSGKLFAWCTKDMHLISVYWGRKQITAPSQRSSYIQNIWRTQKVDIQENIFNNLKTWCTDLNNLKVTCAWQEGWGIEVLCIWITHFWGVGVPRFKYSSLSLNPSLPFSPCVWIIRVLCFLMSQRSVLPPVHCDRPRNGCKDSSCCIHIINPMLLQLLPLWSSLSFPPLGRGGWHTPDCKKVTLYRLRMPSYRWKNRRWAQYCIPHPQ